VLPAWDLVTGQMVATGLLAPSGTGAGRGIGQHVTLALEDMALAVMGHLGFIAEAELGERRERHGNFLFGAFGKDFVSADGERVMVVGLTLKQWRALCRRRDRVRDPRRWAARLGLDLDAEGDRFRAREPIAELVGAWIGARTYDAVRRAFDAHGVCWGRYQSIERLVRDDRAARRPNPLFGRIEQPGVAAPRAGTPLRFSAVAAQRAAPGAAARRAHRGSAARLARLDHAGYGRLSIAASSRVGSAHRARPSSTRLGRQRRPEAGRDRGVRCRRRRRQSPSDRARHVRVRPRISSAPTPCGDDQRDAAQDRGDATTRRSVIGSP
jgi:2-methylfumaryl-CoA isomerase